MLILEFTNDRIKLLEAAGRQKKVVLVNLLKKATSGLSDEAVSALISDLLNEARIRKRGPLTICIPRHLVTVRTLRLPSVDDMELKDMVALQAGKQLPYPVSELIWDFKVIEKRPDGYCDVFLVIVHRNAIDRFVNILNNSKLEADGIVLNSEALSGWYLAVSGFYAKEEPVSEIKAVIDIDTSYVDIVILRGNSLEFSRSFPFKDNPDEITEEIRKTFYSYEKENSRQISSVVMTGIEERAVLLKPLLETIYGAGKIEIIHPLKVISLDYRKGLSEYFDLTKDISFACVLGIAYNPYGIKMDFLPPELKLKRAGKEKRRALFKTSVLLAAITLLLFGVLIKRFIDVKRQLNLINLKVQETEPKVKRLKEISQNVDIIKRHLDIKGSSVDVIREIYKVVPQGISISVLDFELEKSLTLRGISNDLSSVFKFASDLEKSPYFEKCQIKYAQKRMVKAKEFVDFELECRISP